MELWHIIRKVTTTIILYKYFEGDVQNSVDDICVRKKIVPAIRTIDYEVDSLFCTKKVRINESVQMVNQYC